MNKTPELNCRWHFAKQIGGREDGPNNAMQGNFKKTPYASLIRESIQNSLDVPLDSSKPVRVEYVISDIQALNFPNFYELKGHLEGCLKHYATNPDANESYPPMIDYLSDMNECSRLSYIRVSDYNTCGMNYIKGDTTQPFYAFVRAAGVSSKTDTTAGGSYGFGKAAYFYISPIRTLLVSTKTDTGYSFFEGVSSLCTHEFDDNEDIRVSVGYYDNNEGEPISNPDDIPVKFHRCEPGTDILLMGIDAAYDNEKSKADNEDDIYKEMAIAVIRNFWLAVEFNKLEVIIGSPYNKNRRFYNINSQTLPDLMNEFFPDVSDVKAKVNAYNPRPYWEAVHNTCSDSKHFFFEDTLPKLGHVCFYAYKDKQAKDKVLYMRKPLMLVDASRTKSSNGFYGVFVCDDTEGNSILRRTEDAAHREWKSSNWRQNNKIVHEGKEALEELDNFIKDVIDKMFPQNNRDIQQINGLEDFLYIPTEVEEDEDFDNESIVGEVVDIKEEESSSVTTNINSDGKSQDIQTTSVGKILITRNDTTNVTRSKDDRGISAGHGHMHKRKPGGSLSTKNADGRYKESDDGVGCQDLYPIPVRYRSYAQVADNGKTIHYIIIHSDDEYRNAQVNFIVGGEQNDDEVSIISCSEKCSIYKNTLTGLHILEGKNILKIMFADNMKHAIKLEAYEYK